MPHEISDAAPGMPVSAPTAHCIRCVLVQAVPLVAPTPRPDAPHDGMKRPLIRAATPDRCA